MEEEEGALEAELEEHLTENRESLQAVEDALASDVSNSELLMVHGELLEAVKGLEESLLHLKRARLFREVDAMSQQEVAAPVILSNEVTDNSIHSVPSTDLVDLNLPESFSVGSKCRFRHTDGRWYNGFIVNMESESIARVSFLHPTSDKMRMCRFFLQQQCRFGSSCRSSHGLEIQLNALRDFKSTDWRDVPLGSHVLAESENGLWREAELETWDATQQCASIVFSADGRRRVDVTTDNLAVAEHTSANDESMDNNSSDDTDVYEDLSDTEFDDRPPTLGLFMGSVVPLGIQTETVTFAKWETHTRGVASKMMASMGFREGMGLGKMGQGITQPVKVQMLPSRQSLEYANERQQARKSGSTENKSGNNSKKKTRGGRRKREKKWAAVQRIAKSKTQEFEDSQNVFSFINQQLAVQKGNNELNLRSNGSDLMQSVGGTMESEKANRRTIVAHEDEIKDLQNKVNKLQQMAARNRKEKVVYEAVGRKLVEAQKALANAEAVHATTTNAVHSKERERKWLRF